MVSCRTRSCALFARFLVFWRFAVLGEARRVIPSREATKGSLSIQGFYGRGAKAILSALRASG